MSENRIDATFAQLKSEGRAAFIAYVSAGDPDMPKSLDVIRALDRAGADILEIGVPFSDPMADGIVNQLAAQRALEAGATYEKVLDLVREFRTTSETPIVLYTYMNPVYAVGFEAFHEQVEAAGVDGVLLLDLPPDEAGKNPEFVKKGNVRHIRLIAPTTPVERIPQLVETAEGFVYYVSRAGVTGASASLSSDIAANVAEIKKHTELPVAVGFGISTPEQVAEVARAADGVVVGSAIVKKVEEHGADVDLGEKIEAFVKPLVGGVCP